MFSEKGFREFVIRVVGEREIVNDDWINKNRAGSTDIVIISL